MPPADDEDDDLPFDDDDDSPSSGDEFSLDDGDEGDDSEAPFGPPDEPIPVHCLHCGRIYSSTTMQLRYDAALGESAWCCPTEDCDGVGFCFDVWPVDPDWRDADGNPVTSDALPPNFPEKRDDCLWVEGDDELTFDEPTNGGGYRKLPDFDGLPTIWKKGTKPLQPGDEGWDDIPF